MPTPTATRGVAAAIALVPVSGTLILALCGGHLRRLPRDIPVSGAGHATLWVYSDPGCDACARLVAELPTVVRPRDFDVTPVVRPPPPGDWGPWPRLILTGRDGTPLGSLRGYRPPHLLREWIAATLARDRS